jgi:hypothetical protein
VNLGEQGSNCWLDRGMVHSGPSLSTTTHAPHMREVERILSNFMALFGACRASCDRALRQREQRFRNFASWGLFRPGRFIFTARYKIRHQLERVRAKGTGDGNVPRQE